MCQLGDEVRKKEGKLDSTGLTAQNFKHILPMDLNISKKLHE